MTDATTADKLAAWELIKEYGLIIMPAVSDGYWCAFEAVGSRGHGSGKDQLAAVRAWAEAAGVPWPSVNVVPMWALDGAIRIQVYDSRISAEQAAHLNKCRVVPYEVVIFNLKPVRGEANAESVIQSIEDMQKFRATEAGE